MTHTIRKMEPNDTEQVQNVAKASWHSTYEGIIPREVQDQFLAAAYSSERMLQRIERSHLFVAEAEGQIVGFANFSPVNKGGKAELGAIYLFPEAQGKGIGTSLLNKGIEELAGVKEIYINVEKDNEIGRNFYLAKGFELIKEFEEEFEGHVLMTIRMVLRLVS
ncbi:GNAT family N-acetyltransferase [Bacillus infantis]|uniref:GNAT family N-acetyltransferase n=1 Tax=Bacillus infantis TaxID=324767 RepID=A0A5D4SNS7_9BACI|nr:GNAT family N-acetyltransferase [Bacillus infantis]TYS65007.1 GNAT family N-acetyltransferase [Bacillus infantis]